MSKKLAPIVAVAFVASLAACGGGEAPPAPTPTAGAKAPAAAAPASASGYMVAAVTDGGTVMGTVKVTGDVPAPEVVEVNKDNNVCGSEKKMYDVMVGDGGVLEHAVVWLDDIKKGKDWADNKAGEVDQKDCDYAPHFQVLAPGASVEVVNSDPILHNIHAYAGDETLFNIAQPIQGMKTKKTVEKSGPVHLKCDVHSWMSAYIFVAANPYFAVTGPDGSYTLGDVPPGTYAVKVWHAKFGEKSGTATVDAGGNVTLDFELQAS